MPSIVLNGGSRVTAPESFDVLDPGAAEPESRRGGPIRTTRPVSIQQRATGDDLTDALLESLREQDLRIADTVGLHPRLEPTPPSGRRSAAATPIPAVQTAQVEVNVSSFEGAVVLVEQDGIYSWVLPSTASLPAQGSGPEAAQAERRGPGAQQVPGALRFEIPIQASRPAIREPQRGLLGDILFAPIQAYVLKYVARSVVEHGIRFLERNIEPGLVAIGSANPSRWLRTGSVDTSAIPKGRPAQVLLLVHGTFSSTVGGFGALAATEWGENMLNACFQKYDLVLGFDHRTLSEDPRENAEQILNALKEIDWGSSAPHIDAIAHSRGGLVLRTLADQLLPASPWKPQLGTMVLVGATNGGTQLASVENWKAFADLYTNIAMFACRGLALIDTTHTAALVAKQIVSGVGSFVKYLASATVVGEDAPGLSAMAPGSEFLSELNGTASSSDNTYCVITSEFAPSIVSETDVEPKGMPLRFAAAIGEGLVSRLMKGAPNDMVVDTQSMSAIHPAIGHAVRDAFNFGHTPLVYHTTYFARPEVASALARWFDLPKAPEEQASGARTRGPGAIHRGYVGADEGSPSPGLKRGSTWSGAAPPTPALPPLAPAAPSAAPDVPVRAAPAPAAPLPTAPAPAAPAQAPPAETKGQATCYFHASMREKTPLGQRTTVTVSVSGEELLRAVSEVSSGSGPVVVDTARKLLIEVFPKSGWDLVDDDGPIEHEVPAAGQTDDLYFELVPTAIGTGEVWVVIRQRQVPLATLKLFPTVIEPKEKIIDEQGPKVIKATAQSVEAPPLSEPLHQLTILEQKTPEGTVFFFELRSEPLKVLQRAKSKAIATDRQKYVENIYRDIEQRWVASKGQASDFDDALQEVGTSLFQELVPSAIQDTLWEARDKLESIFVVSEEPFIPWELMYLTEPGKPIGQETRFLGEMGLVRWLYEADSFPPIEIRVSPGRAFYVVPDYPSVPSLQLYPLPEAAKEKQFLVERFKARPVDPQPGPLRSLLAGPGAFDILHFACHGMAASDDINEPELLLKGETTASGEYSENFLRADTVASRANLISTTGNRPMVVVNACQAGRATYKLTGIGGFASAFLSRGAGCFVGTLWSVGDSPARNFTEAFYGSLLGDDEGNGKGENVAVAARKAREAAKRSGDSTWLSYVVYGHPHAHLSRS